MRFITLIIPTALRPGGNVIQGLKNPAGWANNNVPGFLNKALRVFGYVSLDKRVQ
ncbi:hypothetical protein [Duganella sp. BuS-21]|uniref:hypothetical protein n=1 Tax=Duganella sp. BuS-21 TaxID=2943848 RepID=UPI0035A70F42